ncbi:MAG: hypothetical protein OEY94_04960 [Alphaproteobacteria bacterium]|nr:hypothetical protein [Alphaproteobacteria bacterium]
MKAFIKVLGFFLINAVGFSVGPFILATAVFGLKIVEVTQDNPDSMIFFDTFLLPITLTWLVCFVFSFASFFLSGLWKKAFLFLPVYIPLLLSIYKIYTFI